MPIAAGLAALAETPAFLGSAPCTDCHPAETEPWAGLDHAPVCTVPPVPFDFNELTFPQEGRNAQFFCNGPRNMVGTDEANCTVRPFEIVGVAGIDPLQEYLLPSEQGRTQVSDIAWNAPG